MSRIVAAQPTPEKVIGRVGEAQRLLMQAGLTYEAFQPIIDDPSLRNRVVQYWLRGGYELSRAEMDAWDIMGDNFVDPYHIAAQFHVQLHEWHAGLHSRVPYSPQTLEVRRHTHILVPLYDISINEMHWRQPDLLDSQAMRVAPWDRDPLRGRWLLIRKNPDLLKEVFHFDELDEWLPPGERLPTLEEAVYAAMLMKLMAPQATSLFGPCKFALTSGRTSTPAPAHFAVGSTSTGKLVVRTVEEPFPNLVIASVCKPDQP